MCRTISGYHTPLVLRAVTFRTHRGVVVVVVEVNLTVVVDIERVITVCRHIGERSLVKSMGRRDEVSGRGQAVKCHSHVQSCLHNTAS